MKNLKIAIIILIIVISSGFQSISGQANEGTFVATERSDLELLNRLRLNHTMKAREEVSYESIDGDPFLYRNLVPGSLTLSTGENIPLNFRYDIFKDEIQFGQKNEIYALINMESVSSVLIDTLRFVYTWYFKSSGDNGSIGNSWFILKKDGECSLLIKKNLRLQAATPPKPYQEEGSPAKFINTRDTYYLKLMGQSAVKIDSRRDLLDILADKKDELSGFIKAKGLDVKEVDDLVKIVSFYNSL
jgi:hypothetical protein